jgi:diaminopimelate epimerase
MKLPFAKYESIGNDFVLVEEKDLAVAGVVDRSKLALAMCDRHFGIGSDGLLTWAKEGNVVSMRMFNPDGTEDFCGNGLRCAALHTKLGGFGGDELHMRHVGRDVVVKFAIGGWIDVGLPPSSFDPKDVPLAEGVGEVFERELTVAGSKLVLCSLIVGSTHTIAFVEGPPEEKTFQIVSPLLENHEWFPERTSVLWTWPTAYNQLKVRIWERGAGETMGCGTGSAAAAACWFRKKGLVAAGVENPGGDCAVALGPGGGLIASAKAKRTFGGEWLSGAAV